MSGKPARTVLEGAIHASISIASPSAIGIATKAEITVARAADARPG